MKTNSIKQLFLLFCFCATPSLLLAQAKPPKTLTINGFSMQINGFVMPLAFTGGLTKFRELAPNSNLLKNDFKNFNQSTWSGYSDYESPSFGMSVIFNWRTKSENWNNFHPKLRFGISTYNINLMQLNMYSERHFIIDTLISKGDGSVYYVDSVETENYDLDYYAQFVFVNAQLLIGGNPANRWIIYGGVGLSVGYSINSQIDIYNYNKQFYNSQVNYNPDPRWSPNNKSENYSGGEGFAVIASIPIGLEFRMSKTERIWENINLFLEGAPSLAFISFSKIGSNSNTATSFAFGLKYHMD